MTLLQYPMARTNIPHLQERIQVNARGRIIWQGTCGMRAEGAFNDPRRRATEPSGNAEPLNFQGICAEMFPAPNA
jgi:hypothetical protein